MDQHITINKEGIDNFEVADALLVLHIFAEQILAIREKRAEAITSVSHHE